MFFWKFKRALSEALAENTKLKAENARLKSEIETRKENEIDLECELSRFQSAASKSVKDKVAAMRKATKG